MNHLLTVNIFEKTAKMTNCPGVFSAVEFLQRNRSEIQEIGIRGTTYQSARYVIPIMCKHMTYILALCMAVWPSMSKPSHMALERTFMDIAVWKKTGRGWQSGLDVNPSNLDHHLHYRWRYARKFSICNFNRSVRYLQRRRVPITQTSKHYHSMR